MPLRNLGDMSIEVGYWVNSYHHKLAVRGIIRGISVRLDLVPNLH